MNLSVVIPTYNQDAAAIQHLSATAKATCPPLEVIVVNDGGSPPLLDAIQARPWPWPVVYIRILIDVPWNQPGARNAGLLISRGDVISFEDVDHLPEPDYYAQAAAAFASATPPAVVMSTRRDGHGNTFTVSPGSWIVRRESIISAGAFDEDYAGHYGYDDVDLRRRLRRFGETLTLDAQLTVSATHSTRGLSRDTTDNTFLFESKKGVIRNAGGLCRFPMVIVPIPPRGETP